MPVHARRAREQVQATAPIGAGQPGHAESGEYTFANLSVRHSALRRASADHPLVVQFLTGVLDSKKRRGCTYIAFRVRGEGSRSYTYEPENPTVRELLSALTANPAAREKWFTLRAIGRDDDAQLRVAPVDPTAGIPRIRWQQLAADIRRSFTTIMGHEPSAAAVRDAVAALAEHEATAAVQQQPRAAA